MKQMWDKKKLEEMIQEEGPQITVDDALSDTSENPVQNKVIYNALEGKQDSLPVTTGKTGKFLKVGSSDLEWDNPLPPVTASEYGKYLKANSSTGDLEWASAGGGGGSGKYLHQLWCSAILKTGSYGTYFYIEIVTEDSNAYNHNAFLQLLKNLGYTNPSLVYGYKSMEFTLGYPNNCFIASRMLGAYVYNNTLYEKTYQTEYTLSVDGSNITYNNTDVGAKDVELSVWSDFVISL